MKYRYLVFSIFTVIILGISFDCNENATKTETLEIANEVFYRKISFSARKPGPVSVIIFNSEKKIIATTDKTSPLFEFVLNNKIITANDPVWIYKSHSIREMDNKGYEYKVIFQGDEEPVKDLEVVLLQQVFPNSTLTREKLILSSGEGKTFHLNKYKENLHFKFPQYAVISNNTTKQQVNATEIRMASWERKALTFNENGDKEKYNHMFYPDIITSPVDENSDKTVKGPINIIYNGLVSWITAYEHASQDNLNGILDKKKNDENKKFVDPLQGTKGVFTFPKTDNDFKFIGIHYHKEDKNIAVSVDLLRGGYLDGEEINAEHPYSTVWTATAFYTGNDLEKGKSIIRNYLFNQICEKQASRKPEFYYNTWGMQRDVSRRKGKELLRGVLTYERIFKEIDRAAQLGVDIFVLDDGWEQTQGVWEPHKERLPEGLTPVKKYLDKYGIKLGVWFSPLGIDSTSERYEAHPEWIIKDSKDKPVSAQWGHPAFDFVSDFFDVFIEDCKKQIDDGALFFKWDAINTLYSDLPNLHHGSDKYSQSELRERYEYLLPIYVTRAMEILIDYEPELIIEIDLTEARRVMMGLAPLSQGKLFFMNNGASWYNDYTSFRTKSMRTISNEYNGLIPLELFTYANYPHNTNNSMHYNVNTSLITGHGFWGNLELMTEQERLEVGRKVSKSKKVLPYISQINTKISGEVGDSPEVYTQVNTEESAGQIIVFSDKAVDFDKQIEIDPQKFLAVLNHPYQLVNNKIALHFQLMERMLTQAAFIIPNEGNNISITKSTCSLDDVNVENGLLEYHTNGPGKQEILWGNQYGKPEIAGSGIIDYSIEEMDEFNKVTIEVNSKTKVTLTAHH